ncbi:IRF8 isoform 2, partial [Pongo abelii]
AWAVFKGKFKEGDKAEPATWKTRLRCALNKSPDFEEVTDRSQLDISEPYKVYRIVPEEEQKCKLGVATAGCVNEVTEMECGRSEIDELIKESCSSSIIARAGFPMAGWCCASGKSFRIWPPCAPNSFSCRLSSSMSGNWQKRLGRAVEPAL